MNEKRGRLAQISVFVIVAVALVAGLLLFFIFRGQLFIENVPKEFKPVYDYYLGCIEEETLIASRIAGHQGGYIDTEKLGFSPGSIHMPFSNQLDFLGNPVPYWYYISGNGIVKEQKPSREKIEQELNFFIQENLKNCDFSSFIAQGYQIKIDKDAMVSTSLEKNSIRVSVDQVLNIYYGNDSYRATSHTKDVDSHLGTFYDIAEKIYDDNQKTLFLENYGIDILRLYAPVDGTEIGCSPKVWSVGAVRENLTRALEANTGFIKIKGDYYRERKDNQYFVHDIGENVDANVNFLYLREWPMKVEIWPSDGNILRADPVGLEEGYGILGFCYVPYHFVYDFSYPVLIQVFYEDELFQFPVVVGIEKNKPRKAENVESRAASVPELCVNRNTRVSVSTFDRSLEPLEVDISFACFDTECPIGRTSLKNNDASLTTLFPQCVNGFIIARADGYETFRYKTTVIDEQSVELALHQLHDLAVEVRTDGKTVDKAIIYFVKNNHSTIVSLLEDNKVSLSDGQYMIKAYVYSDTNLNLEQGSSNQCVDVPRSGIFGLFGATEKKCFDLTIPGQEITSGISGGGVQNFFVTEDELEKSQKIIIDAEDFGSPSTIQELQLNFERIETGRMNVYLE